MIRVPRSVALATLVAFATSLVPPCVYAQDLQFGGDFANDGARERYIDTVRSDMAVTEEVERQYREAERRQAQYDEHLRYWQSMQGYPPPQGQSEASWRDQVRSQVEKFQGWAATNTEHLRRSGERLQVQYQRMNRHSEAVRASRDEIVKQNLGTLIGVAGMSRWVAPVTPVVNPATGASVNPGRITGGELAGGAAQVSRQAASAAIGSNPQRLQAAGQAATGYGARAADARAALPTQGSSGLTGAVGLRGSVGAPAGAPESFVQWSAVPRAPSGGASAGPGVYELHQVRMVRGANGTYAPAGEPLARVATDIPVNVQRGRNWVASADTRAAAEATAVQRQARTQAQQGIDSIKLRAQEQAGTRSGELLNRSGERLQARKDALDAKSAEYAQQNQGHWGQRASYLAQSAAKWAVFSAGVAVTSRAIESYRQDGRIDWGYATQDLRSGTFWTGTAGSFVGSMAASALVSGISSAVPGGAFLRTAAAIGGAAVGWQVGSGNLANTDWTQLGVTTVGATIGSILGSAFGPIGTILGGMIGHFVADFLLNKVRDWLETPSDAYAGREQQYPGSGSPYAGGGYDPGQAPPPDGGGGTPYAGQYPGQYAGPQAPSGGSGGTAELARERGRLYQEFLAAQQQGDVARARELFDQYRALDQQIQAARRSPQLSR